MNPEDLANTIIQGCDNAERVVRAAMATAPRVVTIIINANPLLGPVPQSVKNAIITMIVNAILDAAKLLLEAISIFRQLARSLGRPTDLRAAATTLDDDVQAAASRLTGAMAPAALAGLSPENWDSDATASYSAGLTEQTRAADGIANIVRQLSRTLEDMAKSIETFYSDFQVAFWGLVAAVAGLGFAIATVAETVGVGAIIGLAVAIVGVIVAVIAAVAAFISAGERNAGSAEALAANPAIDWTKSVFAS